jgi:hypothetical protein
MGMDEVLENLSELFEENTEEAHSTLEKIVYILKIGKKSNRKQVVLLDHVVYATELARQYEGREIEVLSYIGNLYGLGYVDQNAIGRRIDNGVRTGDFDFKPARKRPGKRNKARRREQKGF